MPLPNRWYPILLCLLLAGCASVSDRAGGSWRGDTSKLIDAAVLRKNRIDYWHAALQWVGVFGAAPEDRLPGLYRFSADLRAADKRVGADGAGIDRLDAGVLIDRNPNFWRAWLEVGPTDPVFRCYRRW